MTLTSKPLAGIVLVMMFGGIAFSSFMGWWATESNKTPAAFTEGEYAGQANPADIRGSYTFGDISKSFEVSPEVLAQAFHIEGEDLAAFTVKDLEGLNLESEFEIGTASVRLFVAYYTGLPFDTTGQEIYLPQAAAEILRAKGDLPADRLAYLENHSVGAETTLPIPDDAAAPTPTASLPATGTEYTIKGKTTFGELVTWGVPEAFIEQLIGAPMPDPAMTLKDYAAANGLDFETLKPALQAQVDKVKP